MAELDFPTINGNPVSWARITLQIGGESLSGSQALRGFRAISYKTTVERSAVKGCKSRCSDEGGGKQSHNKFHGFPS